MIIESGFGLHLYLYHDSTDREGWALGSGTLCTVNVCGPRNARWAATRAECALAAS
ncbi:MAG: hypothetical protein LH624_06730 [Cryobacterium sp.]|nr:hypothetical protein [Cryobacterium sp.]